MLTPITANLHRISLSYFIGLALESSINWSMLALYRFLDSFISIPGTITLSGQDHAIGTPNNINVHRIIVN
jgi:hypothetical protein